MDFDAEFEYLRHRYKRIFRQIVVKAVTSIENDDIKNRNMIAPEEKSVHQSVESNVWHLTDSELIRMEHMKDKPCSMRLFEETSRYFEDFVQLEMIGKGAFGAVYKAQNKLDRKLYAIKKISIDSKEQNKVDSKAIWAYSIRSFGKSRAWLPWTIRILFDIILLGLNLAMIHLHVLMPKWRIP